MKLFLSSGFFLIAGTIYVMSAKTTKRVAAKASSKTNSATNAAASKTKKPAAKVLKSSKKQTSATRLLLISTFIVAGLVLILSAVLWYSKIYTSPERVFWDMIDNNLAVSGVTREVDQTTATTSSDEITKMVFGADKAALVHKIIVQQNGGGTTPTKITVDGIGTPTQDYQRYTNIQRTLPDGRKPNYSKLSSLWVKGGAGSTSTSSAQLYSQSLLGAVAFGDLTPIDRQNLVSYLRSHQAYSVSLDSVKHQRSGSHPEYVYTVSISLKGLTGALRQYGKIMGIADANSINPNNYSASDKIEVEMVVDTHSRQLRSVNYKNASVVEKYSSYGINSPIIIPDKTISAKTFADLLNQIEK